MTNQDLQELLDILNSKKYQNLIFLRQLNENIFISKVSSKINAPKMKPCFHDFFFITDEEKRFIATIENRGITDLHWYVTPDYRKQGYLTKALKETIIPYIFRDESKCIKTQRITITKGDDEDLNYENSKKVALKVGFKPLNKDETEFELSQDDFDWSDEKIMEVDKIIKDERFLVFKNELSKIHYSFEKICNELLMAYGNTDVLEELMGVSELIKYSVIKVDDLIYFQNERINNIS